ncbi:MAG: UPF0175 family protein [Planctomycetes bacterium]|nr:UPF0175 family protein [Planctomycetota bacterium]
MALQVTLDLPTDVEERLRRESATLDADVQEAFALELFRRGKLTHFELSRVLGLDRVETDALLKQRGIFEQSLTSEDVEQDRQTLERLFGSGIDAKN